MSGYLLWFLKPQFPRGNVEDQVTDTHTVGSITREEPRDKGTALLSKQQTL